jgi:carboxypeptidase Taq
MNDTFTTFHNLTWKLADLQAIKSILSWDQETMMPTRGASSRARQRATAAAFYHERLTDPTLTDLVKRLEDMDLDLSERRSLEEIRHEQEKALCIPRQLVEQLAETSANAYESWHRARAQTDFGTFAPWLEKLIALKREEAICLTVSESPYENLLDEFEPGMKESVLEDLFYRLRPHLSQLLERVTASPDYARIRSFSGKFPIAAQKRFGQEVLTAMGFDWEAGRLDVSPHPFCTGLSPQDVRITTRYDQNDFSVSLFGLIHEGGHALYEQGLNPAHEGLPICEAVSLGIHESQSRLWENHVGRSRAFWDFLLPRLKQVFPGQLEGFSEEEFLLSVNLVRSTPIRISADEVTYGLHIILRFELERALLNGELSVKSLPGEWNNRMESYLGIRPANDSEGVLQDVHWSHGLIGYFPTYLLGNLYAAQMMEQALRDIPDLEQKIGQGRLTPLREWLRTNVHVLGRTLSAAELIEKISGEKLDPAFFLKYLETKFGNLYGI